jgi:hypothetical protein
LKERAKMPPTGVFNGIPRGVLELFLIVGHLIWLRKEAKALSAGFARNPNDCVRDAFNVAQASSL